MFQFHYKIKKEVFFDLGEFYNERGWRLQNHFAFTNIRFIEYLLERTVKM